MNNLRIIYLRDKIFINVIQLYTYITSRSNRVEKIPEIRYNFLINILINQSNVYFLPTKRINNKMQAHHNRH